MYLPISLSVSEIICMVVLIFLKRFLSDNICYWILGVISVFLYYMIGVKVISKITDKKIKSLSIIISSVFLLLSFAFCYLFPNIFLMHLITGSPISNLLLQFIPENFNYYLAIIISILSSQVPIVLILFFSKLRKRKIQNSINEGTTLWINHLQ